MSRIRWCIAVLSIVALVTSCTTTAGSAERAGVSTSPTPGASTAPSPTPATGSTGSTGSTASPGTTPTPTPTTTPTSGTAPASGSGYGPPQPIPAALVATGKGDLKPGVVKLATAGAVRSISSDGSHFIVTADAARNLKAGSVFVVPKIASRKVVSVTPKGDTVDLLTQQASVDELFSDLDANFQGAGDPAGEVVGGDPVIAAGDTPALSQDSATDAGSPTATPTTTGLRSHGSAFRSAECLPKEQMVTLQVGNFSVAPTMGRTPDCSGFTFGADITFGTSELTGTFSLRGKAKVIDVSGHLTAGASGDSQSVKVNFNADGTLGGKAGTSEQGGVQTRYKITWDIIKSDRQILLFDVPFVLRFGVPLIIEPRFSGRNDTMAGKFLDFQCAGTVDIGTGIDSTTKDLCKMNTPTIDSFLTIAPSAFVFAIGSKLGFGPGVVLGDKALIFAGAYATIAMSVGFSNTGGTSSMLLDCIRTDLTIALYFGYEVVFGTGKNTVGAQKEVYEKSSHYNVGSGCPKSGG